MRRYRRVSTASFKQHKHGPAPRSRLPHHCRCGAFVHHGGACERCFQRWLAGIVVLFLLAGLYVRVIG